MKDEDRKRLLQMAKERAKAGSGSDLRAVREERSRYRVGDLVPELRGVAYVIVGGLATARYMPERMTLDTDVLVAAEDLEDAEAALKGSCCTRTGTLTIGGSTWRMPKDRSLDLIALDKPWVHEAIATAVRDDDGYPYIDLPYLVIMKMESSRLQDLADVSRMLGFADSKQLESTRVAVAKFRPQDVEDLESLIQLGKLEHEA